MQLTRFTDLSLRVLMYLAWQPVGKSTTIAEMASAYTVPENHLVKVVHHLAKTGFVQTTRGKGGGVQLLGAKERISIGNVVRQTEPGFDLVDCDLPAPCPLRRGCKLKGALYRATQNFLAELDAITLADMTEMPASEAMILLHPAASPQESGFVRPDRP